MPNIPVLENLRMSLIPEQNFTIRTRLRPIELMHRIRRITDLPNPVFKVAGPSHTNRPYQGDVSRHGFALTEKRGWGTWLRKFALKMTGHFQEENNLTLVKIRIEIDDMARFGLIVAYGLSGLIALGSCVIGLIVWTTHPYGLSRVLLPLTSLAGSTVLIAIIMNILFSIAAAPIREHFEELLKDIDRG